MLRLSTLLALGLTLGCGDPFDAGPYAADTGWNEAIEVVGFLNDAGTTYDLLDHSVGIDSRAALSIVQHRDGADRTWGTDDDNLYESLDEVDAQYYVGPATLDRIVDFALQTDRTPDGGDDYFGSWDGVQFTFAEAERAMDVVNFASRDTLLEVGLDSRAVNSILGARPVRDIHELSLLYYVGESALTKLRDCAQGLLLQESRRI